MTSSEFIYRFQEALSKFGLEPVVKVLLKFKNIDTADDQFVERILDIKSDFEARQILIDLSSKGIDGLIADWYFEKENFVNKIAELKDQLGEKILLLSKAEKKNEVLSDQIYKKDEEIEDLGAKVDELTESLCEMTSMKEEIEDELMEERQNWQSKTAEWATTLAELRKTTMII